MKQTTKDYLNTFALGLTYVVLTYTWVINLR